MKNEKHFFAAPSLVFSDLSNSHFCHMDMGFVTPFFLIRQQMESIS
ncbi:hypothetical protein B4119_1760 [Parageobacillus caldoxylosilyticus]|uniref:Uncharacterized protein n=1 Tax=Saccharococcus caldoxylosilyticus TaxID=81408 RepID=A0A150LVU6_9BACL|nr:hypothetical protein B4119_1760 [Parageobacillus caldoxylosilyticus]